MIRKFTGIVCIYHDDKNYIPARFSCPDLELDDVLLPLTTDDESNYEIVAKTIVDYAYALYCNKTDVKEFSKNPAKFDRNNWKLLDFTDSSKKEAPKTDAEAPKKKSK